MKTIATNLTFLHLIKILIRHHLFALIKSFHITFVASLKTQEMSHHTTVHVHFTTNVQHLTNCFLCFLQFGNTCYCNSVLQALFFCRPFRDKVLQYKQQLKNNKKETLLTCLSDLFYSVATQKKKVGTLAPKKFITRLRKENGNADCLFCFFIIFYAFKCVFCLFLKVLY